MTWNECWRTEGWWVFLIISAYFLSIRQWIYLFIHVQVYKLVYHFQYSHDDRISIYIICLRYQYWIIMTLFDAGSKDVGRDFDICYYHMWSRILFKGFTISRGIKHFFLRKWTFNSQWISYHILVRTQRFNWNAISHIFSLMLSQHRRYFAMDEDD